MLVGICRESIIQNIMAVIQCAMRTYQMVKSNLHVPNALIDTSKRLAD